MVSHVPETTQANLSLISLQNLTNRLHDDRKPVSGGGTMQVVLASRTTLIHINIMACLTRKTSTLVIIGKCHITPRFRFLKQNLVSKK